MRNKYRIILAILLVWAASLYSQTLVLRIDDYGIDNAIFYQQYIKIIQKQKAKTTIAAVPLKTDGKGWTSYEDSLFAFMSSLPCVEIAQHGLSHKSWSYGSEFVGRNLGDQQKDIAEGKWILQQKSGKEIDIFVPPFNSYDATTINALNILNFRIVSANANRYKESITRKGNLKSVPYTVTLHDFVGLKKKDRISADKVYIIMLHGYNFQENASFYEAIDSEYNVANSSDFAFTNLNDFENLLSSLSNPDCVFRSMNEIASNSESYLYNNIYESNMMVRAIPSPRFFRLRNQGFLRFKYSIIHRYGPLFFGILYYVLTAIISFVLLTRVFILFSRTKLFERIVIYAGMLSILIILFLGFSGGFSWKILTLLNITIVCTAYTLLKGYY